MAGDAPRRAHQLVGALHHGDAVGREVLAIRDHLRAAGLESEVFAGSAEPRVAAECRPLAEHAAADGEEAACIYHFSPGSPAGESARRARGPLALVYHNVTPARFFAPWSREAAALAAGAAAELASLAPRTRLALAHSRFSLADLEAAGFARRAALPFLHDTRGTGASSPVVRRLYVDGRTNVLTVGRVAPNKRLEDVLAVFAAFQRVVPRSRLLIVGETRLEAYTLALERLARERRLRDVVFAGHVEEDELRAFYEAADVYLSLSGHEGYGVPLVEAVLAGVPVVARAQGAVAETLAGAGVLVRDEPPAAVAELLAELAGGGPLREAVLAAQAALAARVRAVDPRAAVLEALAPVLEPGA